MGIVIGAVAVVFVLALIIFPGVRGKLKVLGGSDLAALPVLCNRKRRCAHHVLYHSL